MTKLKLSAVTTTCEIAEILCGGGNQIRSFDNTEGIPLALLDPYCTDLAPNGLVRNHARHGSYAVSCCFVSYSLTF